MLNQATNIVAAPSTLKITKLGIYTAMTLLFTHVDNTNRPGSLAMNND